MTSSNDSPRPNAGSRDLPLRLFPLLIASLIVIGDRVTKMLIERHMSAFDSIPVIPEWLRIVHTENPGAAFGMLADGNPVVRGLVLIGISGLVLVFVASALFQRGGSLNSIASRVGLSLILGGAMGNLYDRLLRGTVTDFIEVYHGTWSFPAFNVADSAITVGATLLILDLLWPKRKPVAHHPEYGS